MNDFYVTLPSSVKNPQFDNTSSRYVTRLPQVLRLEKDKYSVAVTDIIYPYSFTNVSRSLNYWIHFKNREPLCLTFPAAQYNNVDEIVETLNDGPVRMKRSASPNPDEPRAKRSIQDKVKGINKQKEDAEKKGKGVIVKAKDVLDQAADDAESAQEEIDDTIKVLKEAEDAEKKAGEVVGNVNKVQEGAEEAEKEGRKVVGDVTNVQEGAAAASGNGVGSVRAKVEDVQEGAAAASGNGVGSVRAKVEDVQDGAAAAAGNAKTQVEVVLGEAAAGKDLPRGGGGTQQQSQQEGSTPQEPEKTEEGSGAGATGESVERRTQTQPVVPGQNGVAVVPAPAPVEQGRVPTRTDIDSSSIQQKLAVIRREKFEHVIEMRDRAVADKQARIEKHWRLRQNWSEIMKAGSKYHKVALDIYKKPEDKNEYEDLKAELVRIRSTVRVTDAQSASRYLKFSNTLDYMEIEFLDDNILFVEFEPSCSYFLGFHDPIIRESCIAPSKVDFFGNVSTIYLYCDIVDPIIVGDQKNSLLSVIPCKGKYGEMVHHTIPYPRYLPIMNNTIDSVKVEFLSEFAEPINFNWGSTIIVLHFKKED